jgi:peptidyl-prolyl cis-trans isomerase SurA
MFLNIFRLTSQQSAAFFLLAALLFNPGQGAAKILDRIVAVVNDDVITLSELEDSGKDYLSRVEKVTPADKRDEVMKEARERVLSKMITQQPISQQAVAANIRLTDEEFTENYEQNLSKMGLSHQDFLRKLEESGLSEERYKADLRNKLLRDKLILYEVRSKVVVTDEMLEEYYETEYAEEITEGGFYLLQMGFSWDAPEGADQTEEQLEAAKAMARKRAEEARQEVVKGGDFSIVARQSSDLPSAEDGGDLGVFQKDELASYMRDAILALHVGEISPIIETPIGFQFFKLLSRQSGEDVEQAPLETVKNELRAKLLKKKFEEAYADWVEKIKEGSYIKRML